MIREADSGNSAGNTARGAAGIFLAEALLLPTGLVTSIYLTRRLGPEEYGLFTLAASLIATVAWTASTLFSRATIKFVSEADDWRPVAATFVRLQFFVGLLATLSIVATAAPISTALAEPRLEAAITLFAADLVLFVLAHAYRGILVGIGRLRERAVVASTRWIARLLLIVALVEVGFDVTGAILGSIAATACELAACVIFVRSPLLLHPGSKIDALWSTVGPLFAFALCMRLFDRLDLFVLTALGGGAEEAGFYGAAQNLSIGPGLIALSVAPVLLSALGRLVRTGEDVTARQTATNALRLAATLLPFAALAAGSAGEVVGLLFGASFDRAAPPFELLIFAAVAMLAVSLSTAMLVAADRLGATLALGLAMLVAAAVGHLLLIPRFGAWGAACVTTAVSAAGATIAAGAACGAWRIRPPLGTITRSVAIGVVVYLAASSFPAPGLWVLAKLASLGLAVPLSLVILGELSSSERERVRSMLARGRWADS